MKNSTLTVLGLSFTALLILLLTKGKTIMEETISKVWDYHSERRIKTLHPSVRELVRDFINEAERQGIKLRVTSALRTHADQAKLYAKGRTEPGNVVTWAEPGESYHNYGLAVDVVEIRDGAAIWNNEKWPQIGQMGKSFGFEWGGDWQGKIDKPHFQMTFGNNIAMLQNKYNAGNFEGDFVALA